MKKLLVAMTTLFFACSGFANDELAYNVLAQDQSVVTAVRTEGPDVWIKLASDHLDATVTVKISNQNGDFYRNWFTGSTDLVSSGFRGDGVWSDRVQTQANFIEYWVDEAMVLHLQKK